MIDGILITRTVGSDETTPENPDVRKVLIALLTPYLTKMISRLPTNEVRVLVCM